MLDGDTSTSRSRLFTELLPREITNLFNPEFKVQSFKDTLQLQPMHTGFSGDINEELRRITVKSFQEEKYVVWTIEHSSKDCYSIKSPFQGPPMKYTRGLECANCETTITSRLEFGGKMETDISFAMSVVFITNCMVKIGR